MSEILYENSMFTTAAERTALVGDSQRCTELFFINYLGFLGLYALNDSRGYMKTYEQTEKKLKVSEIADDNHDASLVVKLCVDSGVLPEAKTVQVTRLLALIKQRSVRSKDIDSVRIRELIAATQLHVKPMNALVKAPVSAFMDGQIDVKEFARQIYEVSKNNLFRPFTTEFRTLVLKGQYTDYFTVMKRTAGAPTVVAAPPAAATKPVATPPPKPVAAKPAAATKSPDEYVDMLVMMINRHGDEGWKVVNDIEQYAHSDPATYQGLVAAIPSIPLSAFGDGWQRGPDSRAPATALDMRALEATAANKQWAKFKWDELVKIDAVRPKVKEIVTAAVRSSVAPESEAEFKNWGRLESLFFAVVPVAEREAVLSSVVDLKAADHKAHLLRATVPYGTTKLVDAGSVGAKASTWIRKYGQQVGSRGYLVISSSMTSATWARLRPEAMLEWVANNFTTGSLSKLNTFMRQVSSPSTLVARTSPSAFTAAKAVIGDKWKDSAIQALTADRASNGEGIDYLARILVVFACDEMLQSGKPFQMQGRQRWAMQEDTAYSVRPLNETVQKFMKMLEEMPATTASEVSRFNDFMEASFGSDLRRFNDSSTTERLIDLKSNDVNKSGVKWLAWASFNRKPPGVEMSGVTVVTLSADKVSAEVADWVKKFGDATARRVYMPELVKTASEAADFLIRAWFDPDFSKPPVMLGEDTWDEMLAMKNDDWMYAAKKVWDARPAGSKLFSSQNSGTVFTNQHVSNYALPAFLTGITRFVVNSVPFDQGKNFSSNLIASEEIRPPMTADKMEYIRKRFVSGRMLLDSDYGFEILKGVVDDKLYNDTSEVDEAILLKMCIAANTNSPDQFYGLCKTIADADIQFMKNILLAFFAGKVIPASLSATYRWMWGFDIEEIKKFVALRNEKWSARPIIDQRSLITYRDQMSIENYEIADDKELVERFEMITAILKAAGFSYTPVTINLAPWAQELGGDALLPVDYSKFGGSMYHSWEKDRKMVEALLEVPGGDAVAKRAMEAVLAAIAGQTIEPSSHYVLDATVATALQAGVDESTIKAAVAGHVKKMIDANAKPAEFATFAQDAQKSTTEFISTEHMAFIVKRLASTDSKIAREAITMLAFNNKSNGKVSDSFIAAARAAGVERASVNRLAKVGSLSQAVSRINGDPNGVKINVTPERMNDFLKYNDVDISAIAIADVKKLEDFGTVSSKIEVAIPPLAVVENTDPVVKKDRVALLHKSNRYNHSPALGLEILRVFDVKLDGQRDRFNAWVAQNPDTKIMTLFHGTGTYAAQFLLRYGFRIIKSTDGSVTGRMLGDGIYFADNINKSMLYMSNAGYIRQAGQEGYVFKCKVALGKRPKDHREGYAERSGLVSNEWSIFNTDQIVIEEAYHGVSRPRGDIMRMLQENDQGYAASMSSFMFMDGMIPITEDILVDFEKLPDFGGHVSIETSAKGPIVNIRHDTTREPVSRCYRYGEELTTRGERANLKEFLDLLHNRY